MAPVPDHFGVLNGVLRTPVGGLVLYVQEDQAYAQSEDGSEAHVHDNWELKVFGKGRTGPNRDTQ